MCKDHPAAVLLIEKQDKANWRIVSRATTARGYSQTQFIEVEKNFRRLWKAQQRRREILTPGYRPLSLIS